MIPHPAPRWIDQNPSQNFEKQEDGASPGCTESEEFSPSEKNTKEKSSFAKPKKALPKKDFLNIAYFRLICLVMTNKSKGKNRHHGF
jgi:hypothetical protein